MNFTQSPDRVIHPGTGNPLHTDSAPLPTVLSAQDVNQVIWSLMRVLADAGVSAANFNPADPSTYNRLSLAVQALGTPLSAFTGANQSLAANGWQRLPGGCILQWGTYTADVAGSASVEQTASITFPLAFPTACRVLVPVAINPPQDGTADAAIVEVSKTASGATVTTVFGGGSGTNTAHGFSWFAIGH